MQSARVLLLVRALKPKQPLLAIKPAGISVKRAVGRHHAMAWHNNRNRVASDRGPHGTGRHNGCLISRHTMSSRNTLGDLAIRSDLATRNRKQLVPNFTLKRRANQMQRRRKPRFLPCKISIQPSPRTLKHRRSRTICRTHRRHAAAGTIARNSRAPPHPPSGHNQQRPHRRPLAVASPQAGAGLGFQNTPQTSVAPCPRLRRSRTRRHTWSRTF